MRDGVIPSRSVACASAEMPGRRRVPAALQWIAATLLLLVGTTGCHHRSRTAYSYPPPPPVASRPDGSARNVPPVIIPGRPQDDNRVNPGRVHTYEVGLASWYGPPYANRRGANGKIYNQYAMTAAHRTLPLGTRVRVTNLATGQSTVVEITDRGPFVRGRILDLSLAAARAIGVYRSGVARVRIEVLSQRENLGTGRWCVQVGAFKQEKNALRLQSELERRYGYTAKVIEFPGPTGHWVRVNPVRSDERDAQQIASAIRLAEPDAQAYVVRLD